MWLGAASRLLAPATLGRSVGALHHGFVGTAGQQIPIPQPGSFLVNSLLLSSIVRGAIAYSPWSFSKIARSTAKASLPLSPAHPTEQAGACPRSDRAFPAPNIHPRRVAASRASQQQHLTMPAILDTYDAVVAQLDSLAPRDPRQPAVDFFAMAAASQTQPMAKRQQAVIQEGIIPTYYNLSGPKPGTVIGIVLGSVAAFLFIVWLLFTLTNSNGTGFKMGTTTAMAGEEEIVVRRRRNSHGNRSRASRRPEVREVSRSPRQSGGRSHIIVDERRTSTRQSRPRSVIVEERHRVPGDDIVEVFEEHDESDYVEERRGSRRGYR